jgi:hypothetical protein
MEFDIHKRWGIFFLHRFSNYCISNKHPTPRSYSVYYLIPYLSEASTVFGHSNVQIAGSNPARGMDVCLYFCVVLSCVGRGFASGRSPVQGVPQNVYRFTSKNPSTPQGKRGRLRKTGRKYRFMKKAVFVCMNFASNTV